MTPQLFIGFRERLNPLFSMKRKMSPKVHRGSPRRLEGLVCYHEEGAVGRNRGGGGK